MNRKKAFTLLELMVTLSIFLILSVMISSILIQGQRTLAKVNSGSIIQDEVRTALLKIQTEAQNSDEVIITNKFGSFNGNQWIVNGVGSSARELIRFINDGEENAKVYVEVNENNEHQLIEFSINKSTNEIIGNYKNVIISKIEGSNANTITLDVEEISDSKGNKINELVTINCSNVVNGNNLNDSDYLISFTRGRENVININVGDEGQTEAEKPGGNENGSSDNDFDNDWQESWEADGIKITLSSKDNWIDNGIYYENWKIEINNNSSFNLFGWELIIQLQTGEITRYYNGDVEYINNNSYKIYTNNFYEKAINTGTTKVLEGQMSEQSIKDVNISNITFRYKKIKEPNNKYIDVGNNIAVKLTMNNQWDGVAQWSINIKNNSSIDVNKWELIFEFEQPIKSVEWGLLFEDLGNNRYKIKNHNQRNLFKNSELIITFESYSGVIDRNLKNIKFNIIN